MFVTLIAWWSAACVWISHWRLRSIIVSAISMAAIRWFLSWRWTLKSRTIWVSCWGIFRTWMVRWISRLWWITRMWVIFVMVTTISTTWWWSGSMVAFMLMKLLVTFRCTRYCSQTVARWFRTFQGLVSNFLQTRVSWRLSTWISRTFIRDSQNATVNSCFNNGVAWCLRFCSALIIQFIRRKANRTNRSLCWIISSSTHVSFWWVTAVWIPIVWWLAVSVKGLVTFFYLLGINIRCQGLWAVATVLTIRSL